MTYNVFGGTLSLTQSISLQSVSSRSAMVGRTHGLSLQGV